jgi:glycolate oxidase iron-sulfur subunit
MQTSLTQDLLRTAEGKEADGILRTCVHCGFCLATCPTYRLLGNELDSPRGRIYLIKQVLEGRQPTASTRLHLDRCLTCRNCETTCPSGVRYGRLLDIGRHLVERKVQRSGFDRILRRLLRMVLPKRKLFAALLRVGQMTRSLAPPALRHMIPRRQPTGTAPNREHARKVILPQGCVQQGMAPRTDAAAARVLDHLGISAIRDRKDGCCGAVSYHLNAQEEARQQARRNIDAWWPHVQAGAEALLSTASGCGVMIKDYGELLAEDPLYAQKAARIAEITRDVAEFLSAQDLTGLRPNSGQRKIAFHPPCTLQHGQRVRGAVEGILTDAGFELTPVPDSHLCCGAAGTYSILQRTLSERLLDEKLQALRCGEPSLIVTANIGCQHHLQGGTDLPVRHWIELLDPAGN